MSMDEHALIPDEKYIEDHFRRFLIHRILQLQARSTKNYYVSTTHPDYGKQMQEPPATAVEFHLVLYDTLKVLGLPRFLADMVWDALRVGYMPGPWGYDRLLDLMDPENQYDRLSNLVNPEGSE